MGRRDCWWDGKASGGTERLPVAATELADGRLMGQSGTCRLCVVQLSQTPPTQSIAWRVKHAPFLSFDTRYSTLFPSFVIRCTRHSSA